MRLFDYRLPFLKRVTDWWRSRFRKPPSAVELPTHTEPTAAPPAPRERKRKRPASDIDEFHFQGAILDQLDSYFRLLERMRKGDRQAYDYFSQVGGHIMPRSGPLKSDATLSPWWRERLPSQGAIFYCGSDLDEMEKRPMEFEDGTIWKHWSAPRAFYFTKHKPNGVSPVIQRVTGGTVYMATIYWDNLTSHKIKHGSPTEFAVVIEADGTVRVLRALLNKSRKVAHYDHRRGSFEVPSREWGLDQFYLDWAAQHKLDPMEHLRGLFIEGANAYESANLSMTRVFVNKGDLTAAFAVNIERTPTFFRDRELTINESGSRRRIFHIVKPHKRVLAGGHEKYVHGHFRGERQFRWNGYDVAITVPGWHHFNLAEVDIAAVDEGSDEFKEHATEKHLSQFEYGRKLRKWMDRGRAGHLEARGGRYR